MSVTLPPFPVDDTTLDMLMAAIDPWNHGDPEAEHSEVGSLLDLLSQMGGSDTRAVAEVLDDGGDGGAEIHVMRDPQYSSYCVITALVGEIRRLRGKDRPIVLAHDDHEQCEREADQLREELGHYKRVVNGSIPDHLMGRHHQLTVDGCLMCQRGVLADDNTRLRAVLARTGDRIERLQTIRTLAETWRAELTADLVHPAEWALATAIDDLAALEGDVMDEG